MVSALDSEASGPGSSPGREHCVVFHFTLTVPHSTQVYRWVPAYFYSPTETGISSGLMNHSALM